MKYTLGLDIGTSSVGWAVIDADPESLPHIENLGVRLFESAENQKDGESLAKPRRDARSARRRLARRGYRLSRIRSIFEKAGLLTSEEIKKILSHPNDPYAIRAKGLDTVLTTEELFIAVYHLSKRRGYKSNRKMASEGDEKHASDEKEKKEVLGNISRNIERLHKDGYRTVGEMLAKQELRRNRPGDYQNSVSREMLFDELQQIIAAQIRLRGDAALPEIAEDITNAFSYQRHYASGDQIKKLVGHCTFEKDEMRAPKSSFSFQYFNLLQKLNHLEVSNIDTASVRKLSAEERSRIVVLALKQKELTYWRLRKELVMSPGERFNSVGYFIRQKDADGKTEDELMEIVEKKAKFPNLSDFIALGKTISVADEEFWGVIEKDTETLDAIALVHTLYKTDEDITGELQKIILSNGQHLPSVVVAKLADEVVYTKFGHLSLKALRKIIPHLEKGLTYDKACTEAGYEFHGRGGVRSRKLPPLSVDDHSITNPVVRRAIAQTIKVVNAVIDRYGSPTEVHLELARDLAKDHRERVDIQKKQRANAEENDRAVEQIKELGVEKPSGMDIIKYRLYREQGAKCMYSGKPIDLERLFDVGYAEVDHIIPYSRSFDDSYANKVLVLGVENQNKLNRTPHEFFGGDKDAWERFETIVNTLHIHPRKKRNLLTKKYVADDLTLRTLNDTRFAARFLKNYIEDHLLFAGGEGARKVITVNGQATAYLRRRWGLSKSREENHRHHAQDAAVVAAASPRLIQKVSRFAKMGEISEYLSAHKGLEAIDPETGDVYSHDEIAIAQEFAIEKHQRKAHFPEPWVGFTSELDARMSDDPAGLLVLRKEKIPAYQTKADLSEIKPIFVSRAARRKVTGPAHQETLRSPKKYKAGVSSSAVRKNLNSLKLKDLEHMSGKDSDKALYEILRKRLEEYGDDPKKAFAEPIHKPRKDGTLGPIVRSVRIEEKSQKSGILIHEENALVDQATMVRIDIFSKQNAKGKEEFYIIPVYAHHFAKGELPDRFSVTGKPETEWGEIDGTYGFRFSLYPNDLVETTKKDKKIFGYYSGFNRSTAAINITPHDQIKSVEGIGVKTLDKFEKYAIDILGNYYPVRNETRQEIKIRSRSQKPQPAR